MTRVENWQQALWFCVEDWRHRSFCWGEHDCARFAAAAVLAVTGEDVLPALGQYASETEADTILADRGGLAAAVDQIIGPRQDIIAARRGDLIQLTDRMGGALAVSVGLNAVALTQHGLREFPMREHRYSWRVG